jgi:signal peptidase
MKPAHPLRRIWRLLCTLVFVATIVVWIVFLRPQFLGGTAGYVTVSGTSMEPHMHTGDVVLLERQKDYRVGDVVAYHIPKGQAGAGRVVIHRVKGGSAKSGYITRGDNRDSDDFWHPKPSDVVGKKLVRFPALGRIARMILSPLGLGLLAALAAIVIVATPPPKRAPEPAAVDGGGSDQRPLVVVGSYRDHREAERAVEHLRDNNVPVTAESIVGRDPAVTRDRGHLVSAKRLRPQRYEVLVEDIHSPHAAQLLLVLRLPWRADAMAPRPFAGASGARKHDLA